MTQDNAIGGTPPETGVESQRRDARDSLFVLARLRHIDDAGEGVTVRVRNVSSGGLMAEVAEDYRPGDRIEVTLEGTGAVRGTVAWAESGRIGIAFEHPIDKNRARKPRPEGASQDLFRPDKLSPKRPPVKPR